MHPLVALETRVKRVATDLVIAKESLRRIWGSIRRAPTWLQLADALTKENAHVMDILRGAMKSTVYRLNNESVMLQKERMSMLRVLAQRHSVFIVFPLFGPLPGRLELMQENMSYKRHYAFTLCKSRVSRTVVDSLARCMGLGSDDLGLTVGRLPVSKTNARATQSR